MYRSVLIPKSPSPSTPRARQHVYIRLCTKPFPPIFTASGSSSLECSWFWSDSTSIAVLAPFFFLGVATLRLAEFSFPPMSSASLVLIDPSRRALLSMCLLLLKHQAHLIASCLRLKLVIRQTLWVSLCTSSVMTSTAWEANGISIVGVRIEGNVDGGIVYGNRVCTGSCGDCFPVIV